MALVPRTGQTHGGLPVSVNAAPADDLASYIARYFVTIIDQPDDHVTNDILLNETALVRVLVRGSWEAQISRRWATYQGPLMFGAQRRAMAVRCTGPMAVAGFAIRPGGWFGLDAAPASDFVDRITSITGAWGAALAEAVRDIDDHAATVARLEAVVRDRVMAMAAPANPAMARFEAMARTAPTMAVTDAADALAMTPRQFDRRVRRHFGHLPKTVLRRSRFLDMAAVMQGLAVPDADAEAEDRFFDASHLNREFRLFVDMTPGAFRRTSTPLLTPGLELRQQRKLKDLALLEPGQIAPWLA